MSALPKVMWLETLLLIGLFLAFISGALDGKTFAYLTIAVLVIFAVPAAKLIAKHRVDREARNG